MVIAVLWIVGLSRPAVQPQDLEEQVRRRVRKLEAADPAERETAIRDLEAMGASILPLLDRVPEPENPESQERLRLLRSRLLFAQRMAECFGDRWERFMTETQDALRGLESQDPRERADALALLTGYDARYRPDGSPEYADHTGRVQDPEIRALWQRDAPRMERALAHALEGIETFPEIHRLRIEHIALASAAQRRLVGFQPLTSNGIRPLVLRWVRWEGEETHGPAYLSWQAFPQVAQPEDRAWVLEELGRPEVLASWRASHLLRAVGATEMREAIPRLRELLARPEPIVRAGAAGALAKFAPEEGGPALVELLEDPEVSVRRAALDGLIQLGYAPAGSQAARLAREDEAQSVRTAAVALLTKLGQPEAVATLLHVAQEDSDREVRVQAIQGLGQQPSVNEGHVRALVELVRELDDDYVRWAAWCVMGDFASRFPAALAEPLAKAVREESLLARDTILTGLQEHPIQELPEELSSAVEEASQDADPLIALRAALILANEGRGESLDRALCLVQTDPEQWHSRLGQFAGGPYVGVGVCPEDDLVEILMRRAPAAVQTQLDMRAELAVRCSWRDAATAVCEALGLRMVLAETFSSDLLNRELHPPVSLQTPREILAWLIEQARWQVLPLPSESGGLLWASVEQVRRILAEE